MNPAPGAPARSDLATTDRLLALAGRPAGLGPPNAPGHRRARRCLYTVRGGTYLEAYYAAAVRSMSMSWHDFFFAAFDPAGTVTLDKLPGAFWIQALSVRAFGVGTWAIILPQVVEGVLSVLVLYRIVRRLCGPAAGLIAAALLALAPATVALNRGNIADTFMILALLLAADATVASVTDGRWRSLLLAGFWVGLAFQAKMIEAWIVLPALAVVYLTAAGAHLGRRALRVGRHGGGRRAGVFELDDRGDPDAGVIAAVRRREPGQLALPAGLRLQRIRAPRPNVPQPAPDPIDRPEDSATTSPGVESAAHRFVRPGLRLAASGGARGAGGRPGKTRRAPRGDPMRTSFVLWGTWLLALAVTFSFSSSINSYYTAALSPPIAGLIAAGSLLAWRARRSLWARCTVGAATVMTVVYAAWLLPATGTGLPGWLASVVIVVGLGAAVAVLVSPRRRCSTGPGCQPASPRRWRRCRWSRRWLPFRSPPIGSGRSTRHSSHEVVTLGVRAFFGVLPADPRLLPPLEQARRGAPYLMATQTSALAAPFIYVSGQEVLPIGGFTGTIPSPSLSALKSMIRSGTFHLVLQSPTTTDPRLVWIAEHCTSLPQPHRPAHTPSTACALRHPDVTALPRRSLDRHPIY